MPVLLTVWVSLCGGTLADRAARIYVWNMRPRNLRCATEKWNEFLTA